MGGCRSTVSILIPQGQASCGYRGVGHLPASLQRQITSLAQVALQNRRALDPLSAEKGGTCLFLQEQGCHRISETGLVAEDVHALYRLQEGLGKQQNATLP
nr:ERV-BabFcenv provirus ancestral Env polyprotein-like isoform X2 [Saimiri boliviensis boliviensis]